MQSIASSAVTCLGRPARCHQELGDEASGDGRHELTWVTWRSYRRRVSEAPSLFRKGFAFEPLTALPRLNCNIGRYIGKFRDEIQSAGFQCFPRSGTLSYKGA